MKLVLLKSSFQYESNDTNYPIDFVAQLLPYKLVLICMKLI
jgi:hypothetical protein